MPNNCCVRGCNTDSGFHFPSDPEIREKWVIAVNRQSWAPKKHTVVCHKHFKPDDFVVPNLTLHGKFFNLKLDVNFKAIQPRIDVLLFYVLL